MKAERIEGEVKVIKEESFILTLTREEAETLLRISKMIAGDPKNSRRGHVDSIREALEDLGVEDIGASITEHCLYNGIYFQREDI